MDFFSSDFSSFFFSVFFSYTATGTVAVFENSTGAYFTLTGASLLKNGTLTPNAVVAHLHEQTCENNDAGGHFLKDLSMRTPAVLANELWASPATGDPVPAAQPASGTWNGAGKLEGFSFGDRSDFKAIIIHEYADPAGALPAPKRVCCNLKADDAATTAPAPTTAAPSGNATTAAGTTAAGTTAAAVTKCTTEECCKAFEADARPCTKCLTATGCQFFGLLNNNALAIGGQCKLGPAANSSVAYREVKTADECVDKCAKLTCTDCIGDGAAAKGTAGCVWCDSGKALSDKVGTNLGSTGTCELAKCIAESSKQTTCTGSASALVASALAVLAAVASLF